MATTVILAILTLGFLGLSFYRRSWAVAVFVALLPVYLVRFQLAIPGLPAIPSTWLEILFATLFLPWLFQRGFRLEAWWKMRRYASPIVLLLVGSAVGILVSGETISGLGLWRAYFLEPILFFAIFTDTITDVASRRRVLIAMAVTAAVVGLTAVFQKFTGYGIPNPIWQAAETRRITAFYGFPNAVGLFLAPLTVIFGAWALALFFRPDGRRSPWPYLLAILTVLGLISCLFAVSKGALIGIGVGLAVYGLADRRLRPAALVAVILACLVVSAYRPVTNLAGRIVAGREDSSSVRVVIWNETIEMLKDRPVFGGGLSGYPTAIAPYHLARHIEVFQYPHNIILNLWTEIGLIGLIGFAWLLTVFFRLTARLASSGKSWLPLALLCAMITILVHGLVDVPYFKNDLAMQFWILLGLAESLAKPDLS